MISRHKFTLLDDAQDAVRTAPHVALPDVRIAPPDTLPLYAPFEDGTVAAGLSPIAHPALAPHRLAPLPGHDGLGLHLDVNPPLTPSDTLPPDTGLKIAFLHEDNTGDPNYYNTMQLGLSNGNLADEQVVNIDSTDVGPGTFGAAPDHITVLGSNFIFEATDHTHGRELWISDGTVSGTHLLKDIDTVSPTASNSAFGGYNNPSRDDNYNSPVVMNGKMYFSATDGTHGYELWATDGTSGGTTMVTDIYAGASSSNPSWMTVLNNKIYFVVGDATHAGQIWSTDGTTTSQVTTISTSGADVAMWGEPSAFSLTASGGHIFFDWFDASDNISTFQQLWVLDPNSSTGATELTTTATGAPGNLKDVNGVLYFNMDDGTHGSELWRSDGTHAGTYMVADINPSGGSQPYDFVQMGSWIYFVANDGTHGSELWKTDGIVGGTTQLVKDIASPSEAYSDPQGNAFFSGSHLTVIGNTLYFAAEDGGGGHGMTLWKSDGTDAGTVLVDSDLSYSYPSELTNINGVLYFEAADHNTGQNAIWKTDGTQAGTVVVAEGTNGELNPFAFIAPVPAVAMNDAFSVAENATISGSPNLFNDNGSGADTGSGDTVAKVNGSAASVGNQITLASGAHLTVDADGTFAYDPNHAFDSLPGAASGASNTSATDSFTYSLGNGSTATVTVTINGVDSNDTLQGTSGNDTIDGGSGTNTYVLTGAHTDYAISYNSTTGVTTLADQRGGSPDGTDAVKNVQFFHFSDGTESFAFSGNSLLSYNIVFNDGSSTTGLYDPNNAENWSQAVTQHDTAGNMTSQTVTEDNGTTWTDIYDPTNANGTAWTSTHYDSGGHALETTTTNDDGTHTLTINDVANQYSWATVTVTYNSSWNITGLTGTNDDSSHTITWNQVEPAFDTLEWFATPFDRDIGAAPESLTLTGGTGTDYLFGHAGNDSISGGGGNDFIEGGLGIDSLTGGAGADRFFFTNGDGQDEISDFTPGTDTIELHSYGVTTFAALQALMTTVGSDTVITFDPDDTITLHNVSQAQLHAGDFLFSA